MPTPPQSPASDDLVVRGPDGGRGAPDACRHPGLQELASVIRDAGAGRPASPTREILERLGDQWSVLLLSVLETGDFRHAEVWRAVNELNRLVPKAAISQRMLTLRLRTLERNGLVHRSTQHATGSSIHYRLSPLGHGLMRHLRGVLQWSIDNAGEITVAQSRFDADRSVRPSGRVHRSR